MPEEGKDHMQLRGKGPTGSPESTKGWKMQEGSFPGPAGELSHADTLTSDFWSPEPRQNKARLL